MSREQMRFFTSRFRFQDNSLGYFTEEERKQIKKFQDYVEKTADGFCSVCLKLLYPEEQCFRKINNEENLKNCTSWKFTPMKHQDDIRYMVCKAHQKMKEENFPTYFYPGMYKFVIN